ncbi:MAG: GatB/YqeY domain-containing protein [Christensenellales bacterium]
MTLEELKKAKVEAMKNHDKDGVSALNLVINKVMLQSIELKAQGKEISEADIVSVLQKAEKELIEEREAFNKAGRAESVASLDRQIETVKKYMPKLMSEDEIKAEIEKLDDKTVPSVMKHFKSNFAGKVDMKLVGEVLKKI